MAQQQKEKPIGQNIQSDINCIRKELSYSELTLSDDNVRVQDTTAIDSLAESIESVGVLQNIIVNPPKTGKKFHEIIAGKRRFMALTQLLESKKISKEYLIPVLVVPEGNNISVSLLENIQRQSMHPIDEMRAFAKLRDEGKSVSEISTTLGFKEQQVYQRLAMANASPKIQQACLDGEIGLSLLKIFGQIEEHTKQDEIYDSIPENQRNEHSIRRLIGDDKTPLNDKGVLFVGLEEYKKAGGGTVEDMFSDDPAHSFITDDALLTKMLLEKMKIIQSEAEKEGWSWIEFKTEDFYYPHQDGYTSLNKTQRKLSEEEEKKLGELSETKSMRHNAWLEDDTGDEEIERLSDEADNDYELYRQSLLVDPDKSKCGLVLHLETSGEVERHEFLITKEEQNALIKKERGDSNENKEKPSIPQTLTQSLYSHRALGIHATMMNKPKHALVYLVYDLVFYTFHASKYQTKLLDCQYDSFDGYIKQNINDLDSVKAYKEINEKYEYWLKFLPDNTDDMFYFLCKQKQDVLLKLMAFCLGSIANVEHSNGDDGFKKMGKHLELEMSNYWIADSANFFGKMNKKQISSSVKLAGIEDTSTLDMGGKKADIAHEAEGLVKLGNPTWVPDVLKT